MTVWRLLSMFGLCAVVSVTVVSAQPTKDDKTPAATPAAAPGAGAGSAVDMPEDPPPKDPDGRDENPGAPGGVNAVVAPTVTAKAEPKRTGYPIEEALRPINLTAGTSEVAIGPHAQLSPYRGADALRARYGITNRVQLGLTYMLGGVFNESEVDPMLDDKIAFHSGKAVGLDITVLLRSWVGVRVGVPVYIKPVAVSLALGVPMKFTFGERWAVGGLDDLLTITLKEFPPSFYQEADNFLGSRNEETGTEQSPGSLRFTGFGIFNYKPNLAFVGRLGMVFDDFETNKTSGGGLIYLLRAGLQWTPKKYLDIGFSLGFDDLSETGSFGPAGLLALRI